MKDQLIRYIDLLFAGAPHAADVKQEILQNTLDRYDDLISQGKSPEAAYSLAISGIGDINEILSGLSPAPASSAAPARSSDPEPADTPEKKKYRAIAIAMYILCPVPLFILSEFGLDTLGLCLTLALVACATYLIVIYGKKDTNLDGPAPQEDSPRQELRRNVRSVIWTIGLIAYFLISFATQAWYITWVIFPLIGAVQGLVIACMDLKEANNYEN